MALGSAAKGAAAHYVVRAITTAIASGAMFSQADRAYARTREPLIQPPQIRSENGMLQTTLTAAPGLVQMGHFSFPGFLYNDMYLPPLLRVRVGDRMLITLKNNLSKNPSNLHFHGMSVSPRDNSDNVFIHVDPGRQFEYEVHIPAAGRQGPGFFWYHPHAHGFVAQQILGGMSGGLVVDGFEQFFPILRGLPERFFFIKDPERGNGSQIVSVNGQINPTVDIRAGEMQFWRIGHIGATLFIKFHIIGMSLFIVARDGHPLSTPQKASEFFIGPGERIDAIAIGPKRGEYAMETIPFQNQAWRKPDPVQQIATVVSRGSETPTKNSESELLRQHVEGNTWINDVRSAPIVRRRTLKYSRTPDRRAFMINGRVMDEDRVDQTVRLGDTEEWSIINTDQQYHSFHIHQTAFLVTEINGVPHNEPSLRDTFSIPPATKKGLGSIKVVIPFADPVIVGRFVYHCHAVDHEDKGMMGVVEVLA